MFSNCNLPRICRKSYHYFNNLKKECFLNHCWKGVNTVSQLNPLPDMPILGFSNSAAKKRYVKIMVKWGYN